MDMSDELSDLEEVEKLCQRLVVRAIYDYLPNALKIFSEETDNVADVAEDLTREALDKLGMSRINLRLYGKIDYKQAIVIFLTEREVEVALFIDSKAEKDDNTATLQMSQTTMEVRQKRAGQDVGIKGELPILVEKSGKALQTVTIIVKYVYDDANQIKNLVKIVVACIPSGVFQDKYNPNPEKSIWLAGRNAYSLGEDFRVRLAFKKLADVSSWRVRIIDANITKT
ncbi:MAG: SfiI family type II restriction endonuclease [Candidatus Pacebacteria bacterium]|nr:SfiI family type II restriction endonuclease [Candidatus Paceibacterota bacterium]